MSIQTDQFTEARIIAPTPSSPIEEALERALRPKQLDEYVGQVKIRDQLEIFITAARKRKGDFMSLRAVRHPGLKDRDVLEPAFRAKVEEAIDAIVGVLFDHTAFSSGLSGDSVGVFFP